MSSPQAPVDALLHAAAQARAAGRHAEEVGLLDRAIAAQPPSPRAFNARGMRALADRAHAVAVACFGRAAALDPGEPSLRINLATAHRASGDTDGERSALQGALDLDPVHFIARLRMAELLGRQGLVSQSAGHWAAVVQLGASMPADSPTVADALARGRAFLDDHNRAYGDALEAEFGGAMPAGEGARRFRGCVDHMLGRRQVYRNECAGVYYPFLPADEFFDRALFPWFAELEAHTDAIRREAVALIDDAGDDLRPYVRLDRGTPDNKWSGLDQSLDWGACFLWEYGLRNDATCTRCPETAAALARVPQSHLPGKAPSAFFSVLRPGVRIPPHTGVSNTRAVAHLPLIVPPGCGFRVGGETREWREGEAFAFDDTIEHEAWNTSGSVRVVLILDVWNPHLTDVEQAWLTKLFAIADRGLLAPAAG